MGAATDDDFATEFLAVKLSVGVGAVSLDAAIDHVNRFGSGHTEAILTRDPHVARRFTHEVDAAAVVVNASTRFTDGEEFGFGAESIGISTQKLHGWGPMGVEQLTTVKYVVWGRGTGEGIVAERFSSVDEVVFDRLRTVDYLADTGIAGVVYLADRLEKPVLVEGPAGVGKTELAKAIAEITGSRLIRLQCYEGLDESKALYEWNYKKQLLRIQADREHENDWATVESASSPSRSLAVAGSRPAARSSATTARTTTPRCSATTSLARRPTGRRHFVSAYATTHPWEDFAETWAHYLHIIDTLEMADAFGLRVSPKVAKTDDLDADDRLRPLCAGLDPAAGRGLAAADLRGEQPEPLHGHGGPVSLRAVAAGDREAGLRASVDPRGQPGPGEAVKAGEKVFSPDPSSIFPSLALAARQVPTHKKEGWGSGREYFFLPDLAYSGIATPPAAASAPSFFQVASSISMPAAPRACSARCSTSPG